jgi:H+-translocating NAD(P) transhydrogenase subunit alpha
MSSPTENLLKQALEAKDLAEKALSKAQISFDSMQALTGASNNAINPFIFWLAIFVLAIFIGYYVVWSVTPALHTPLMSVTNAISSVIVVGALLAVGVSSTAEGAGFARFFGFIALVLAGINIFGGFLVTERMLAMYKPKESKSKVTNNGSAAK